MRTFAYLNCLDPASSYKHFKEWFVWAFQSLREQQIRQLEGRARGEELQAAEDRIRVVQQAIDSFLHPTTGWHRLEYSVSQEKSLVLSHDLYGTLDVDRLSDGIRGVLAMIGDIAYRCIKLNPHLGAEAARQTGGVILIDEVDMHLHPGWQQIILAQLQAAFPRVQFIVTTHSPQVLSTVKRENIRVLIQDGQGSSQIETPTQEIIGLESSTALNDVMGVNPVPPVEAARWVADYMAAIENGRHDSEIGLALREKLQAVYGPGHPVLRDADRLIRFQSFKRRQTSEAEGRD